MLNELNYGPETGSAKAERCKPDYELLITRARDKNAKVSHLIVALQEYTGPQIYRQKLAELYGELMSEQWKLQNEIDHLIEAQEEDKD